MSKVLSKCIDKDDDFIDSCSDDSNEAKLKVIPNYFDDNFDDDSSIKRQQINIIPHSVQIINSDTNQSNLEIQ